MWLPWRVRHQHVGMEYPGVYAISHSERVLTSKPFSWIREIIYIGMTNSAAGLRGRLQQFDNTIAGRRTEHGGADRVRYRHRRYRPLCERLYVAVASFECNVSSVEPFDLRMMGGVAQYEYQCLASFAERFKKIPEFNDRKNAPKFSLTVARRRH